jgi:branched-chain amino acid transport system ATP-binding protein
MRHASSPSHDVSAPASPLIEARELHAHYGHSHVLRGVSLTIRRGEAIGLLGRNGMGKTPLIRTLLAHVRASRGEVHVRGEDCTFARPQRIARLGVAYVPEGRGIFPNLSVRENLVLAARAGPDGRRSWTLPRVLDVFPRLAARLRHGGSELSGGEQQMLAIARALLTNPDVMLLDEATEGLAPLIVQEIWRIVGDIRSDGIAVLVVDRNARSVLRHTDRALVMEKGVIVREGASAALLANPHALARHLGV